jgi:CSLREA domain-containing protein
MRTRYFKPAARLSTSARLLVILLLAQPVLTIWSAPAALAATPIVVTTTADEFGGGVGCSLREAIQSANTGSNFGGCTGANAAANTITLPAGTYTLTGAADEDSNASGDLDIEGTLTINGDAAKTTIIQAGTDSTNGVDRVLDILGNATVEINGVTIRYGQAPDGIDGAGNAACRGDDGGGIYVAWSAILVLNNCVVHYNRAGAGGDGCTTTNPLDRVGGDGGGIFNEGTLELNSSRVMHNESGAGGAGTATGTFSGTGGRGGGIYLDGSVSQATLTNSAVNLNHTAAGGRGADASSGDAGAGGNSGSGGGIYSLFGDLTLIDSTVAQNTTGDGGDGGDASSGNGGDGGYSGHGAGLHSYGGNATVVVANSVVNDNTVGLAGSGGSGSVSNGADGWRGSGGGFKAESGSGVTLTDTTIKDNTGQAGGGLDGSGSGTVITLDGCTVSGNHATQYGGGIRSGGGATMALTNSTVSGNTADEHGGGIYNGATTTLTFVTVAYNTADLDGVGVNGDGGGFFAGGTFTMTNTIVAENTDTSGENPDCHSGFGAVTMSGDYNLLGISNSANCDFDSQTHDLEGTMASPLDPLLGVLGDKGGPTWTHSLNLSSPAVGYIPAGVNGCVLGIRDQRGVLRFPPCNIGAFEAERVEHTYLPMVVKH